MPSRTETPPTQLDRLIGTPGAPDPIDVRVDEDFDADPRLIPTAFRWPDRRIEAQAPRLAGRRAVVIRQKGLKLRDLSRIVRGADTDRADLTPQSAGLLAASLGLSAIHGDDLAQLEAGMILFEAVYRRARDAKAETNDWTPEAGS